MARFSGVIGYGETVESPPASGKYVMQITEYPYSGDVLRNTRGLEEGVGVNKNITVGNRISVVADEYANKHFFAIKYVMWQGVRWTVTNVEVQHPRLILSMGEVYNGPTP
jgi:hypothetical protein